MEETETFISYLAGTNEAEYQNLYTFAVDSLTFANKVHIFHWSCDSGFHHTHFQTVYETIRDFADQLVVIAGAAVRDDVHGAAQCIAAETGGNHAFIDFDPVDDVHGKVRQRHAGTFGVERHPVEEIADGVARHAVDGEVEVAADTALLPDPDAGGPVDGGRKAVQSAGLYADIQGTDRIRPFPDALFPALGRDDRLPQGQRIIEPAGHFQRVLRVGSATQAHSQ